VFDKTGTLTEGRPVVSNIEAAPGAAVSTGELLALAAAVEEGTTHPIGRAIVAARDGRRGERWRADDGSSEQARRFVMSLCL
jgi:cation transport ATPase